MSQKAFLKSAPPRSLRVGEMVRRSVASSLLNISLNHPGVYELGLTITSVRMTDDLKLAFINVIPGENCKSTHKEVVKILEGYVKEIRKNLSKDVACKTVPGVKFKIDEHLLEAQRVEALLDSIKV